MDKINDPLKDLSEIRSMMEKSSKFLSLSGLSGISAGIVALAGSYVILLKIRELKQFGVSENLPFFFIILALIILILALGTAIFFTTRNAKKKNLPVWTPVTKYLLTSLVSALNSRRFVFFNSLV